MMNPMQIGRSSGIHGLPPMQEHAPNADTTQIAHVFVLSDGPVQTDHRRLPLAPGTPYNSSAQLRTEAKALAAELSQTPGEPLSLRQTTRRMILEGQYLSEHRAQSVHFNLVSQRLGLPDPLGAKVHAERLTLSKALQKILSHPELDALTELAGSLRTAMQDQASLMASCAAVYDEVLAQLDISIEDRRHISSSQLGFSDYANKLSAEIPAMIEQVLSKAANIARVLEDMPGHLDEASQWKSAAEQLRALKYDLDGDFADAVGQVNLAHVLKGYEQANYASFAGVKAFLGGVGPQMLASGLAFGLVRAMTEISGGGRDLR